MTELIFKSAHAFWPSGEWRVKSNKAQTVRIADCSVGLMSDLSCACCFDTLGKQTSDTPLIAVNRATAEFVALPLHERQWVCYRHSAT